VWPAELENDRIEEQSRYFSPTYQVGADVTQRWFGNPRNTLGTGGFLRRRSSPGVFVDRGYGGNVSFTRDLTPRTPASLSYVFEINRVEAGSVYFCVNYGVCDAPTISALGGQQRLSPALLSFRQNNTDSPLSPTRGTRMRAEIEHASRATLSDFRYNRAYGESSAYRRIGFRRAVLAARARLGWVDALSGTNAAVGVESSGSLDAGGEVLHPRTRFYAGGSQSVRGYGENQLGPRVLTIDPGKLLRADTLADPTSPCRPGASNAAAGDCVNRPGLSDDDFVPRPVGGTMLVEGSVEARIPVWGPVTAAVFVDGALLGERSLSSIGEGTGAVTPGVGVRYISPVGPIRVDIGYRPRTTEALPVITQVGTAGNRGLVDLSQLDQTSGCGGQARRGCRVYSGGEGFLRRLTLHLSIGEAF
jgi:outer membrane protein insertion porin family/translocation and assembly module TamA